MFDLWSTDMIDNQVDKQKKPFLFFDILNKRSPAQWGAIILDRAQLFWGGEGALRTSHQSGVAPHLGVKTF